MQIWERLVPQDALCSANKHRERAQTVQMRAVEQLRWLAQAGQIGKWPPMLNNQHSSPAHPLAA